MSKIKLNLASLSIPEKVARAQQIVSSLTGNSNFTSPQPSLPAITAAINALSAAFAAAQEARSEAKNKTTIQNEMEDALDGVLSQLADYVAGISGDDETKITSAGMDIKAERSAVGDLAAPTGMEAAAGDRDGEIDLTWDKVKGTRSYVIERSADPPTTTSWSHAAIATRSQTTVGGLTSGTKYWFRVAAIGATGQSPWSDPATKFAP